MRVMEQGRVSVCEREAWVGDGGLRVTSGSSTVPSPPPPSLSPPLPPPLSHKRTRAFASTWSRLGLST